MSAQVVRAVVAWLPTYDEITIFVFISVWPVYIILVGVYVVLAARIRPGTLWAIASALGLVHGVGFTMFVYFQNQPGAAYKLTADDVVMTFNASCADMALPEDPALRSVIAVDRHLSPSSDIRGDTAIAYDLDGDSKAELIIPLRCDAQGSCFWVVVATGPTREHGVLSGASLLVLRSETPWPDVVGYDPGPARLRVHRHESHGPAYGEAYSIGGQLTLTDAEVDRFVTAAPRPQCGRATE